MALYIRDPHHIVLFYGVIFVKLMKIIRSHSGIGGGCD